MAFGHFHLGSHNFMVTALGSCVKWPLVKIHLNPMWMWRDGIYIPGTSRDEWRALSGRPHKTLFLVIWTGLWP